MDYFNDVLPMFLDFDCGGILAVYGRVRELSEFIQNILICVLKMNEWWKSYRLFFRQKRSIVCCQKCSDVTFKSSSFLFLANACDQHEDVAKSVQQNLLSWLEIPDRADSYLNDVFTWKFRTPKVIAHLLKFWALKNTFVCVSVLVASILNY